MTQKRCDEKEFIEQLESNGVFENIDDGNVETHRCNCLCLHSLGFTPQDVKQYVSYHREVEEDRNKMKTLLQAYRNTYLHSLHLHKDKLDRIEILLKQLHMKGGT